jgi:protoporphyrinogen/coproporphyrinogen III oxidase
VLGVTARLIWQAVPVGGGRRRLRVAVIGAGIGGLAAAHRLVEAADVEVTVFEGTQAVGGKLQLGQVGGVAVDLGAESILTRRPEGLALARAVGLADSIAHPSVLGANVWTRGRVRPLPPTLMGVPGNPRAAARSGILSRHAALRASFEPRLPRIDVTDDISVGRLVSRRLGPEVRDRMVDPMLGGVYAGNADDLSLHAAVPQLAAALREHPSLLTAARAILGSAATAESQSDAAGSSPASVGEVGEQPVFAGIDGGVGRLAREVARAIQAKGASVRFGDMVREVSRTDSRWRVVSGPTSRARADNFDGVVVATPARAAGRMLHDEVPAAAMELSEIEYASVAIVTVAFDAAALNADLSGSGFLVPQVDAQTIKAATYSSRKWAWQAGEVVVMRCSVGRHGEEAELQGDDDDLVAASVRDLQKATGLRASLLDARVTRWGGALPQYAVGHLDRVARIRSAIAAAPGLDVCGAYLEGVGIPAVIASGQAAATRVMADLVAPETMEA